MLVFSISKASAQRNGLVFSIIVFLLLALALPWVSFVSFTAFKTSTVATSTAEISPAIEQYIKDDQLKIQPAADGSLRAWSKVKGLFYTDRATFHPLEKGDWQVAFSLSNLTPVTPTAHDNIVEYRYPNGITEIYENRVEGIEQKFIVANQESGIRNQELVLQGTFETTLTPERIPGQGIVFNDKNGVSQFSYGEATAFDAMGKKVSVDLSFEQSREPLLDSASLHSKYIIFLSLSTLGLTFPVTIDPLITTPATTLDPTDQATAWFGRAVATAGDVNGDGYSDVVIGAELWDGEAADEGRVYIYHGSSSGLSSTPTLILDPADQAGAFFGFSVATAGDVNGDGYSDVVVGAYSWDGEAADEGRAYVYHGSSSGLSSNPALTLDPADQTAFFGFSVATAGDVNGDGYSDVVIGAELWGGLPAFSEGRMYIYHGSSSGLSATPALTLDPTDQATALFGRVVATAGDVNGDGYSDVVISAGGWTGEAADEGRVYVYHGSSSGLSSTPALILDPTDQASANFGHSVSTAGDVNGDGYSDVVIGAFLWDGEATDEGRAYIYYGSTSGLSASSVLTLDPTDQAIASFGGAVATAGDINGDGYSDVIVGAYRYDGEATDEGRVYLFRGSPDALSSTVGLNLDPTDQASAFFGSSVKSAGDVNGDGYTDVIIAASFWDGEATDEGRVYVYHGSSSGLSSTPAITLDPTNQASAFFGSTSIGDGISTAGDVNGDGYADVVIGANGFTTETGAEGRTYIYYGSASGLPANPSLTLDPTDQVNSNFGYAVATAGDVNSDGYADVVIGAVLWDGEATDEGRAYIYYGSSSGLSSTPALILDPTNQAIASFGGAVATAGDINGDGYSDVIVGAYRYDGEAIDEGRSYIYHGSSSGLSSTPALILDPTNEASARFSASVSTAGDANGDGYADVVIASESADGDVVNEGRAYIYHGSASGLSATPATTLDPANQISGFVGFNASGAGDVNGDGYTDVLLGVNDFDAEAANEGRAYLFYGGGTGLALQPAQLRAGSDTFVVAGSASDSSSSFRAQLFARTPAGRGNVRVEVEAKPITTAFNGSSTTLSSVTNTGVAGTAVPVTISGLSAGTDYHWRARLLYNQSPTYYLGGFSSRWVYFFGAAGVDVQTYGNPTPTLSSISPSRATAESSSFTLTATGSSFVSGAVVRFGSTDLTTTFVSSTQLTATVPATSITTPGSYSITVFNPTPGGGTSNVQTFTVDPPPSGTTTPATPAPAAPTNINATYNSSPTPSITLTWTDPPSNANRIEIWRNEGAGTALTGPRTNVSLHVQTYTDTENLTADTTYLYQLIAVGTGGRTISQEVAVSTTTPAQPEPVQPTPILGQYALTLSKAVAVTSATQPVAGSFGAFSPAFSVAFAIAVTLFLFSGGLLYLHHGDGHGSTSLFAFFPMLFIAPHSSYMRLRGCRKEECRGRHFTVHRGLVHLGRLSFIGTAASGIVKLSFAVALTFFVPASDSLLAQTPQFTDAGKTVYAGDLLTYELTLTNTGTKALTNVLLTDQFPAGTDYVSGSLTVDGTALSSTPEQGVLSITQATLPAGEVRLVRFSVRVQENAPALLSNSAQSSSSEITDPVSSNVVSNVFAVRPVAVQPLVQEEVALEPSPAPTPLVQEPQAQEQPSEPALAQESAVPGAPAQQAAAPSVSETSATSSGGETVPVAQTPVLFTEVPIITAAQTEPVLEIQVETVVEAAIVKLEEIAPAIAKPIRFVNTQVLQNPVVEQVSTAVAVPVVITTAAAAAATTAALPAFLPFLKFLTTQPLLLFARRKRKAWGTVYNAITKLPVDLAIVRLFNAVTGQLVQTRVTDKHGRIAFIVGAGTYRLKVSKPNFTYPSMIMADKTTDLSFSTLYHDERITVEKDGTLLAPNIPLDPNLPEETPQAVIRKTRLNRLNLMVGAVSIGTSFAAFVITPRLVALSPLLAHFLLYLLFKRLALSKRPAKLSRIFDLGTRSALPYAIARIFDTQYHKLLETQVTDRSGKYGFLVGPNEYYVAVEKPGYEKVTTAVINLKNRLQPGIVSIEVPLRRAS